VTQVEFFLNNFTRTRDVRPALVRLSYGGDRVDLAAALNLVRSRVFTTEHGARPSRLAKPPVARLAVIFTKNRSDNLTASVLEATATRRAGIGIVVVGIGTQLHPVYTMKQT